MGRPRKLRLRQARCVRWPGENGARLVRGVREICAWKHFFGLNFYGPARRTGRAATFLRAAAVKKKVEALEAINWQVKFDVWNEFRALIINNLHLNGRQLPSLRSHGRYAAVESLILFF